ncbi:hypothetical protein [Spirosoma jeollabukense]
MAKAIAVVISEKQLARNSRERLTVKSIFYKRGFSEYSYVS